jgi:hypothetical protein
MNRLRLRLKYTHSASNFVALYHANFPDGEHMPDPEGNVVQFREHAL